jgi:predicted adenylyl cyclase CyaB
MKEIEVKLTYKDKDKVIERLKEVGAVFREKYLLEDHYFSLTGTDMSNTNDLLRVRKKGDQKELTLKGKCETEGNIWERIELNTDISDAEAVLKMFEHLKLNNLSINKSYREFWDIGDTELVFSDITYPAEISFLEIEGPTKERVEEVLKMFEGLVEEAGEEIFRKLDEARKAAKKSA